ncbi:hypothetical protein AGMMS49992_21760 [Clostridia bacterium]|nr:hypothetical protein AGMMS49992_21760 [Clostridia bacterium]
MSAGTIDEAIRLFNETWDLIDKTDRTPQDDAQMLHKSHTSAFMWQQAMNPANNARGEWQVSHCYALLKMGAPALLHGQLSLNLCLDNDIGGLDLAFGYEAVARAYAVLGDAANAREHIRSASEAAQNVADPGDRKYVLGEIANIETLLIN